MSIDGTVFFYPRTATYSIAREDYSHKFHHAGLCYEIGVGLGCSKIVHIAGGVPAGEWPDLQLARYCLVPKLTSAASRLQPIFVIKTGICIFLHRFKILERNAKTLMSRHETVNKRFEHFEALATWKFLHSRTEQAAFFEAIANLVQLILQDEPL
jgi:hypothetical protein